MSKKYFILLTQLCCYVRVCSLHLLVISVILWWLLLFLEMFFFPFFLINGRLLFHLPTMSLLRSVTSAEQRPCLQLLKRDQSDPPVRVFNRSWQDTTLILLLQVNFELGKCLNWLFFCRFSYVEGFYKKGLNISAGKNLACSLSAQQQQPMFRACCPVPVLGGVIHPSASHWHERFMFILDQSVCLFIKGFDQSTPWPPGSSYPSRWSHPVHSISRKFRNTLQFFMFLF